MKKITILTTAAILFLGLFATAQIKKGKILPISSISSKTYNAITEQYVKNSDVTPDNMYISQDDNVFKVTDGDNKYYYAITKTTSIDKSDKDFIISNYSGIDALADDIMIIFGVRKDDDNNGFLIIMKPRDNSKTYFFSKN